MNPKDDRDGGVVFVLGAGASRCAGAPLMNDFFRRAKKLHKSGKLKFDAKKYAFLIDDVRGSLLSSCNIKSNVDIDNLEDVYSAIEMVRLIDGIKNKKHDFSRNDAEQAIAYMQELIQIVLETSITFKKSGTMVEPPAPYNEIAKVLDEYRLKNKFPISVITFNYDVLMEYAFAYTKVHYTYGFEYFRDNYPRINLYKLHGSLNWGTLPGTGNIDFIPIDEEEIMNMAKEYEHIRDNVKGINLHFGEDYWSKRDIKAKYPYIVPPSASKLESQMELRQIWSRAAKSLNRAEIIFFIGYSLPESDIFFKNFFALSTFGPSDFEKIIVVNPEEGAFERVQSMLSQREIDSDRVTHEKLYFEESVDLIVDCLKSHQKDYE